MKSRSSQVLPHSSRVTASSLLASICLLAACGGGGGGGDEAVSGSTPAPGGSTVPVATPSPGTTPAPVAAPVPVTTPAPAPARTPTARTPAPAQTPAPARGPAPAPAPTTTVLNSGNALSQFSKVFTLATLGLHQGPRQATVTLAAVAEANLVPDPDPPARRAVSGTQLTLPSDRCAAGGTLDISVIDRDRNSLLSTADDLTAQMADCNDGASVVDGNLSFTRLTLQRGTDGRMASMTSNLTFIAFNQAEASGFSSLTSGSGALTYRLIGSAFEMTFTSTSLSVRDSTRAATTLRSYSASLVQAGAEATTNYKGMVTIGTNSLTFDTVPALQRSSANLANLLGGRFTVTARDGSAVSLVVAGENNLSLELCPTAATCANLGPVGWGDIYVPTPTTAGR